MNALHKVLVVDSGDRPASDVLSIELAELGLSSVTASFEAAEEVLGVIETPSAIFLNMPQPSRTTHYASFLRLADQLRTGQRTSGVPVIMWDRHSAAIAGGISAVLRTEIGPQALAEPDL